jgi:hypothetical protein
MSYDATNNESGKKRGPDISWSSQEAEYPNSQELTNSQDVVQPTITYSAKELQELDERIDARRRKIDTEWPGNRKEYLTKFGESRSSKRLDPHEHVAKKIELKTSEEVKTYTGKIIDDLMNLINDQELQETLGKKGSSLQIQEEMENISTNLSLLITKLREEGHRDEEIMLLCKAQIEPFNLDSQTRSKRIYTILSDFLEDELNSKETKPGTEEALPMPGGGSKSVKRRFKTQKKSKSKGKGKSVRRRRGKRTKKPKSNRKQLTKRLKK